MVRFVAVVMSLLTLSACAPAAVSSSTAAPTGGSQAGSQSKAASNAGGDNDGASDSDGGADCTKATKTTISANAFSPSSVTIQRGAIMAFVNKSDVTRTLKTSPDAGIVTSVVDAGERQIVQFPQEGTFTVKTGKAELQVTVSGESGCKEPSTTLTLTQTGTIAPAKAEVKATENFLLTNGSGKAQTLKCSPSSGGTSTIEKGESQILAVDEAGTYKCTTATGRVTITVK